MQACCRPLSTWFHLLQELHDFSSCFVCQVQGDFWMETIASHSCRRLVQSRSLFPNRTLLDLVRLPLISSIPHFPRLVLQNLDILITLPMLCPFFPLCLTTVLQTRTLIFFLQVLCSSSPCCGLSEFVQETSTSLRTLNNLSHFIVDAPPPSFSSHLPFSFSLTSNTTSAWCLPILDGSTVSRSLPPTAQ